MEIKEYVGDLFDLDPKKYVFAHCISKDCSLGAGIAVAFAKKHKELKSSCKSFVSKTEKPIGKAYRHEDSKGVVYNLFTKPLAWMKAGYPNLKKDKYLSNLESTLIDLKEQMVSNNEKHLGIPRIACGLDRCKWKEVRPIIEKVFEDTDIEIVVKRLK